MKAAFLYNFAKFVEWPPDSFTSATSILQICILGQDPFGSELTRISSGKIVNNHPLEIKHPPDVQAARDCHILFVAVSERSQISSIVAGLRGCNALTVSDTRGFTEQGGMINFVLEQDRVQFEVNVKAAERAGLKVSSKLLSVAKAVTE